MPRANVEWTLEGMGKEGRYIAHDTSGRQVSGELSVRIVNMGKTAALSWLHTVLPLLAKEARANCPVRTGELRDSITSFVVDSELFGMYGSPCDHAIYPEVGTSKMTGQHYLENALRIIT